MAKPDALLEKPATGTACPREWVNLSYALDAGIPYADAAHGTIRGAHEAKFCAFFKDSALCPTIEDIVTGQATPQSEVHLSAFTATLAAALKEDEQAIEHFPPVYRWIAEQSADCEIIFAKYAIEFLHTSLIASPDSIPVLTSDPAKSGTHDH